MARPDPAAVPLTPERAIIIVIGRTGCGKSTWAKHYVRDNRRLLVYDPFGSFAHVEWIDDVGELFARYPDGPRHYRVGTDSDVEGVGLLAYRWLASTLVIEEAADVFPRNEDPPDWARWAVYKGRHRRESLIVIAQRASSIPIWLRSQATRFVTFQQSEPQDVRWLQGVFPREWLEELPRLPPLTCYDSHAGTLTRYQVSFT